MELLIFEWKIDEKFFSMKKKLYFRMIFLTHENFNFFKIDIYWFFNFGFVSMKIRNLWKFRPSWFELGLIQAKFRLVDIWPTFWFYELEK